MAKVRKKDKDTSKWKKKKWYSIVAPNMFNNAFLGETTTFSPQKVLEKSIKVNLMNLTGEVKNQNINIKFKVKDIVENKATTEVIGYVLSPAFIKRIIRRKHTRIDDTLTLVTKDKKEIKIKPLYITRNIVNRSETTGIKKSAQEKFAKMAESLNFEDFFRNVVQYRLQLDMRKKLSKIYPLKSCEIKKIDLIQKATTN